ncbi:hypothetical protein [Ferrimonas kyonanensis]|uniref:hypothetical protein n=1 Tax=Ferrimonas kyonanensis TaxID=364763 RepID=UPI00054D4015|nr:hypothetical protein [Ferrimonas kyonanensis]
MECLKMLSEIISNVTPMAALIAIVVGIWKSFSTIRLKINAEVRLKKAAEIESQIKLMNLFTKLVETVHARKDDFLSETMVAHLIKESQTGKIDLDKAIVTSSVGGASQDAAIESITLLALKHELLKEPALKALKNLQSIDSKRDDITKSIERIEQGGQ